MTSPSRSAEGNRLRRALARIAAGLGLGVVFTSSLLFGALLHLDTPAARRQIERFARSAVAGTFDGEVIASGFDHVGLDGLAVRDVTVRDPEGHEVLHAHNVVARASVLTIARGLVLGDDLRIRLPFLRIEALDAFVQPNARGELGIATAFNPRATGEPSGPGRPLHFTLADAQIGRIHAVGMPDGAHAIDASAEELRGSVRVEPGLLAVDLAPMRITETATLARPIEGVVDLRLRSFSKKDANDPTPNKTMFGATFTGCAGRVCGAATALLDGDHVEAAAVVPRALDADLLELAPDLPIADAVAVSVSARGDLPTLDLQVRALTDAHGSAAAGGQLVLGKPVRAEITFTTDALDPRGAIATAPSIAVTSRGRVHADLGATPFVRVEVATDPTALGATPIPGIDATAVLRDRTWLGSASVHEPGAPAQASFATTEDGAIHFDAAVQAPSLRDVPRLRAAKLTGAAIAHANGSFRGGALDASFDGHVHGFHAGPTTSLEHATVRGTLRGPTDALVVSARVQATEAHAGDYGAETATIHVRGPVTRPTIRADVLDLRHNTIRASATVDTAAPAAERVRLRIEREGTVAEGRIARVGTRNGALAIEGLAFDSPDFGKIEGTVRVAGGELFGHLTAEDVDLAAIRKFVGLPRALEGHADLAIDLRRAKGGRAGSVHFALHNGGGDVVPAVFVNGVSATFDAAFDGDRVQARAEAQLSGRGGRCAGPIAKLRIHDGNARIAGPLLDAGTWSAATGKITVAAEDWDLACLAEESPFPLPLTEIFGQVDAKLTLDRPEKQRFPSVRDLAVATRYLSIVGPDPRTSAPDGTPEAPWSSRDLDVELHADVDGATGDVAVHASLFDQDRLADLAAFTTLDLGALLDPAARTKMLGSAPIAAHATVPRRALAQVKSLPSMLRDKLPSLTGEATVDAYLAGTVDHPRAVVRARGFHVAVAPDPSEPSDSPWDAPVDFDAAAATDGAHALLEAHARQQQKTARVSPEAHVSVRTVPGRGGDTNAVASVHFLDPRGGALDATGYVGVKWQSGLVPMPRDDRPADLAASFRRFRLSTVEPFLGGSVRGLRGFLDGDVRAGWGRLADTKEASIIADLAFDRTRFHLPTLGQELRISGPKNAPLHLTADRTGAIKLDQFVVRGSSGQLVGDVTAHLDGLRFKDAAGKMAIDENDPLPLTLEGAEVGTLWGAVTLDAKSAPDPSQADKSLVTLALDSSNLHLKIPSTSTRDVQSLERNPDIVVIQERVPPPHPTSASGLDLRVIARLEEMVVEGEGIRVTLSTFDKTPPSVLITDRAHASGDIRLVRGSVEVMGRKFELDQGTIHLRDEASNPYLDVTAHWDAPDGSTIFVDYNGVLLPITQDKLRFRSNPPRTQQESLAMLLFGSETGGELTRETPNQPPGPGFKEEVGRKAADLGGELAAQQFNALLKGIAPLKGLSTKLGATDTGAVTTSLTYQVGDTIKATATYQGGSSGQTGGTPGSTTTTGGTSTTAPGASVSLDWRFYKSWLLRATVGTSSDLPKGEVDVLWQYRY
ncbi:MAG: translocation/assembly module TamB domain-containing protein [Polyangiaceae bacterium]